MLSRIWTQDSFAVAVFEEYDEEVMKGKDTAELRSSYTPAQVDFFGRSSTSFLKTSPLRPTMQASFIIFRCVVPRSKHSDAAFS